MPDTQNHPSIDVQILEYLSTQPTSEIRGIVANVHANMWWLLLSSADKAIVCNLVSLQEWSEGHLQAARYVSFYYIFLLFFAPHFNTEEKQKIHRTIRTGFDEAKAKLAA